MSNIIALFVAIFVLALALSLLLAFPVMWLWNWLMPEIFGLPVITFWQAFGLMVLSSFFFKSSNVSSSSK